MENKIVDPTTQRTEANHTIDANFINIDIPAIIQQIKNEKAWNESDRNAETIFKTNGLSIVLIALHKNAEMKQHKVDGLLSVQVIEGEIKFVTDEETINLKNGQLVALHSGILHSIIATEETTFLLTVTTSKKQFTD